MGLGAPTQPNAAHFRRRVIEEGKRPGRPAEMMGSCEWAESYFPSTAAMDDEVHPRPDFEDSVDEALFTVSGCNTPMLEAAPVIDGAQTNTGGHQREPCISTVWTDISRDDARESVAVSGHTVVGRSKPIAIEHTKPKSATFTGPVSARGGLAVGYFTLHEKEGGSAHIYPPHPPAQEIKRSRQRSSGEAEASAAAVGQEEAPDISSDTSEPATFTVQRARTAPPVPIAGEHEPERTGSRARANPTWRARTAPIVEVYNPTGIAESGASLGKYYPTNYEAPDASDTALQHPGPASDLSFTLSKTDQARQLRQYQRDMISQTLQKAREALGRTMHSTASTRAAEAVLDEGSRKSVASGFALLRRYKPLSPRITPLLSPGPVTPMALDKDGESDYITVRGARLR
ncbi:hypothetical protein BR93DRAFT_557562 [Coniochaeta sp. PMI_546]|nr:hypothetical protein BR93DRAFT_557562 [Coniochaeta sp. PMI_546]